MIGELEAHALECAVCLQTTQIYL